MVTGGFRYALIMVPALLAPACHRHEQSSSVIAMSDQTSAKQLISGFYGLEGEGNSWRWTARRFTASLKPPEGAATRGARLVVHLFVPDSQIEVTGPLTLDASIDNKPLAPETFSKGGSYEYVRTLPAAVLDTNILPVEFCLDKAHRASEDDPRELGIVVSKLELVSP